MRVLFILFVVLPIIEIWILIRVGGVIGTAPTIALILFTAVLGAVLLRMQGRMTLAQAQSKLAQGSMPIEELVAGLFLAVGGALLLTPGFLTDAIGFSCLIPGLRKVIIVWGVKHVKMPGQFQSFHTQTSYHSSYHSDTNSSGHTSGHTKVFQSEKETESNVIDGECSRDD